MAHEIDGIGRIKVFTFSVNYDVSETTRKRFTDYAAGWDWARALVADWEGIDAENTAAIDWDFEWVEESFLESYLEGVCFKVCYGIKAFNSDGSERPHDISTTGRRYDSIEAAEHDLHVWFDGQCNELRIHALSARRHEQAFAYIEAVAADGSDGYELCDSNTKRRIDASYKTLDGGEV